jgi:Flagellar hook-length control protein FliK
MTAPAAAPAASAIALPALRAAPQPAADRFAFAAMLDSLPGAAAAKSGAASAAGEGSRTSSEARRSEAQSAQPDGHPTGDVALLPGLPFAPPSALATDIAASPVEASTSAPPLLKSASLATSVASVAAAVEPAKPAAARLTGERAFHLALATSSLASTAPSQTAGPLSADAASFAPGPAAGESGNAPKGASRQARLANEALGPTRAAEPSGQSVSPPPADPPPSPGLTPTASKAPTAAPHEAAPSASPTASPIRAAAQDPVSGGRKAEAPAPPSALRVAGPAAPSAGDERGDKAADRPPDPPASPAQPAPQASVFGSPAPSGAAITSSGPLDSTTAAEADAAPRASAPAASPASAAPVKEIDVDLSPSGLEHVSMTMRLAGDRLSVVVRAASSQTAGSIEGARDAIADRMAAIGQPLDSLIVRQTGGNADATTNGYGASADEGSTSGDSQAGPGAGGHGGSGDPSSSRRGAYRDRGF